MADTLHLMIVTPEKTYFDGDVNSLLVTTPTGQLGILAHHTDMVAIVEISPLVIHKNGHVKTYSVGGGEMHIQQKENTVTLLVSSIEAAEDIDKERALRAKQRAEEALQEATSFRDQYRAEVRLKRALNRLNISSKVI